VVEIDNAYQAHSNRQFDLPRMLELWVRLGSGLVTWGYYRMRSALSIRTAETADSEAIGALLIESYSNLLADFYERQVLESALPYLSKPNPMLLESGTYYVVEEGSRLVGCGGWTSAEPRSGNIVEGEGHIRHFAVHPNWARRAVGTALLTHCFSEAEAQGIRILHCLSTLNAKGFYQACGFKPLRPVRVPIGHSTMFPAHLMSCDITGR
jgi:N-acetylglutamate synthase-like GNAT family acetyltransferase